MCGLLNAQEGDYLLWNIERTITKIYIPVLLDSCMGDKGSKDLLTKVKKELLPWGSHPCQYLEKSQSILQGRVGKSEHVLPKFSLNP